MTDTTALDNVLAWLYADDPLGAPGIEEQSRLLLLDTLGCFIAATAKPEPAALSRELAKRELGRVRLPGTSVDLAPSAAAFVFGLAACWDEACEGLARAHGRPGLHALPPALALALSDDRSLGALLRALVTGYEIGGRLGEVCRIRPGMHVDGTWGAFAAAVAASRMLSADNPRLAADAVAATACQVPYSLYLPVAEGATARNSYVGHGAMLGLRMAETTQAGVGVPPGALETFHQAALGGSGAPLQVAPVGEHLILQGYLKPFAAVRHVHYGAVLAQAWRGKYGPATNGIENLKLAIYAEALQYCGNRAPETAIQAQFSLSYGLARTLVAGDLAPDAYTDAALADKETRRLEALVRIETDPEIEASGARGAKLTVGGAAGTGDFEVAGISGDPDRPLGRDVVADKFQRYAGPVLGEDAAQTLVRNLLEAPLEASVRALLNTPK